MSALLLKRFLQRPFQVAYIVPSSKTLVRRVAQRMDLSQPKVIVEYGPGEGCHTREILKRMHPDSQLLLFELDPELAEHLQKQFRGESRVTVLNADAFTLQGELAKRGHSHCDYVVSGIPFSLWGARKKQELMQITYQALAPKYGSAFLAYQMTTELVQHCPQFARVESQFCLQNIPPMFVLKFHRMANGHSHGTNGTNGANGSNGSNGHAKNGVNGHSIPLNGKAVNGHVHHDRAAT